MPRILTFIVDEKYDGCKLVSFLRGRCGLSSRLVGTLKRVENGMVVNGVRSRTIDRVKAGDTVEVALPDEECFIEPVNAEISVIYEDDDLLVINKSPFMAMHPTHNHQGDTLANAVAAHLAKEGKVCTFRAAGRLDKGTSGAVVCALNRFAAYALNGNIKKEYIALVSGELSGSGSIDVPIYRPDPMKTLRACSYELGKEAALTNWEVLQKYAGATLVSVRPETGRTHQIRVHFAFMGMPLAGDNMYGSFMPEIGHQLLHCRSCTFIHPVTKKEMTVECPPPPDFTQALESLQKMQ